MKIRAFINTDLNLHALMSIALLSLENIITKSTALWPAMSKE